jgi:hypothetical protein
MPDFIVKRGVMFDGEPYHPGETITLTEEQAAALLRIGALKPVPEPAQEPEASLDTEAAPPPKKSGPKPKPESAA